MSGKSDEYSASRRPTPFDRKATEKLPRAVMPEEDEITKVRCPICLGCGVVDPEIAALTAGTLVEMGENR